MRSNSRDDFRVAIICALPLEFDAVQALLDERYDESISRFGQKGDANWYRTGRIGQHDVVLTFLPDKGRRSAASAASSLLVSFGRVSLALVVGICGAVPMSQDGGNIILGDVITGDSVVEHGSGKQYPDGYRPTVEFKDITGRPNRELRAFLSGLKAQYMHCQVQKELSCNLVCLQEYSDTN
ncbi:nucleoside phosphorylase domain-containing protein [Aspergillus aurantiobrunneus]